MSRANLRKSLENPETSLWSEERVARTQYRLSTVLQQREKRQEAKELRCCASKILHRIRSSFDIEFDQENDFTRYDYLAPIESGRSVGKVHVGALK